MALSREVVYNQCCLSSTFVDRTELSWRLHSLNFKDLSTLQRVLAAYPTRKHQLRLSCSLVAAEPTLEVTEKPHADSAAWRNSSKSKQVPEGSFCAKKPCVERGSRAQRKREAQRQLTARLTQCTQPKEIFGLVEEFGDSFSGVNAVTAFYTTARLSRGLRPADKAALQTCERLQKLLKLVTGRINRCQWRGLANLSWAESHLQVGGAAFYGAVEEAALQLPLQPTPKEQEVVPLVSSFARSGIPSPHLFSLVASLVQPNVAKYDSWQLAQIAWSFAKARQLNTELLDAVKREALGRLDTFTCQSLSLLLWSWTELGLDDKELIDKIAETVESRVQQYPPVDISISARSFAKTGRDYATVLTALVRRSKDVVNLFAAENVAGLIWSLATAKFYDEELLRMLLSSHVAKIPALTPQEASNLLWGLATLRYFDPAFMDAVASNICTRLESFGDVQLGSVLFAFATFGHSGPPEFLSTMADEVVLRLRNKAEFKRASLVHIAWSFMVLRFYQAELFARTRVALCRAAFFEHEYAMLHQVEMALRLEAPSILPRFVLNDVNEYFEDLWLTGRTKHLARLYWTKTNMKGSNLVTSALQRSVQTALERLGIPCVEEYIDEDYMIDIAIPEHRIAIEVDGAFHYSANTKTRAMGPTLLKHRLLRSLGWKLVVVPHYEWQSLEGDDARDQYMYKHVGPLIRASEDRETSKEIESAKATPTKEEASSSASGETDESAQPSEASKSHILARSEKLKMLGASRGKVGKISMLKDAALRRALLSKGGAADEPSGKKTKQDT